MCAMTTPVPAVTRRVGAMIEVRALPWRPRRRRIDPDRLRVDATDLAFDDLAGAVIGLVGTVLLFVLAPLLAVVIAILLLPFEALLVAVLAVLLIAARFTGVIPWTVLVVDAAGAEHRETFRFLPSAVRRVRALTGARPRVRWSWS